MTSGLFNTGGTGDSAAVEITSDPRATLPCHKVMDFDLASDLDDPNLGAEVFGDLDFDPLGDRSLDSFMDIGALMAGSNFLESDEVDPVVNFFGDDAADRKPLKRLFREVEPDTTSDLAQLSANVGLPLEQDSDHDYSAKRPRMSLVKSEQNADQFLNTCFFPAPIPSTSAPSPAPLPPSHSPAPLSPSPSLAPLSPAPSVSGEDKSHVRRVKNNIASKRSREIRKAKFKDMEGEVGRLTAEIAAKEKRVVQLERLAKEMKAILLSRLGVPKAE